MVATRRFDGERTVRAVMWAVAVFLVVSLVGFFVRRILIETGQINGIAFDRRYTDHWLIAYAHIVPGVIFVVLAPFQLSAASIVFGVYMGAALVLAVRAARGHDRLTHRRWMIRAFAVALGVATIRIILSLGEEFDLLTFDEAFGPSFWAGLSINAVAAELWLRRSKPPSRVGPEAA